MEAQVSSSMASLRSSVALPLPLSFPACSADHSAPSTARAGEGSGDEERTNRSESVGGTFGGDGAPDLDSAVAGNVVVAENDSG